MLDVESDYIYIGDDDFDCRMIRSSRELLIQIVSTGDRHLPHSFVQFCYEMRFFTHSEMRRPSARLNAALTSPMTLPIIFCSTPDG